MSITPITTESALLRFLEAYAIHYSRIEHPAVYTCEEAAQYRSDMPGVETKNLFLKDAAGSFYLVMTACEKRLDLKGLGQSIGAAKLHFGSPEQLLEVLGLTPGSVTVLALVNDPSHQVNLLIDDAYWPAQAYLCHPMVNTSTLVIPYDDLLRFFEITGHAVKITRMPAAG